LKNTTNPSITADFIAKRFTTNSKNPKTGISRNSLYDDYWNDKNKLDIVNLIKEDLDKYQIVLKHCPFVNNEFKRYNHE
jgi:hypothetical protein